MSSDADAPPNGSTLTTVDGKHLRRPDRVKRHAEAQERYREKNLEATRAKARERMQRQGLSLTFSARCSQSTSASDSALIVHLNKSFKRQKTGAVATWTTTSTNYRVSRRRLRFVAKYGHLNYLDYYCPQYKLQGKRHLAGLRFDDLEKAIRQNKCRGGDAGRSFTCRKRTCLVSFVHPMSSHRVCEIPFKPNPENYKNDSEHDANARKHWYLVLGVGLFTKKKPMQCGDGGGTAFGATPRTTTEIPRHTTDPDDGEDDEEPDTDTEIVASHVLPRAQSAAPSGRAASSVPRSTRAGPRATPRRVCVPPVTPMQTPQSAKRRHKARTSVLPHDLAVKIKYELSTPVLPKRDVSVAKGGLSVKHELDASVKRKVSVKQERKVSVKRKRGVSVKPETLALYADMSDSELTDALPQEEDPTDDDMPPLLYGVEGDQGDIDVLMPLQSPVPVPVPPTISATVSTVSSLSSDSSVGWEELISGARPIAQPMGAAGPSRISALSADARAASAGTGGVRVLFNSSTRRLYPDPMQVFAEVKPGESLQVIEQEEVVEYCAGQSARLGT
ncbi:hypothetical protein B0H14DRAFT_2630520 [Mycena olivaceomarginata]|nr:hypothetical protein B0H14DRAFT_2630520 [Mycena olivaceomarginata]